MSPFIMQLNQQPNNPYDQTESNVVHRFKISLFYKPLLVKVCFSLLLFISIFIKPAYANASFFSEIVDKVLGNDIQAAEITTEGSESLHNSQTVPLLESSVNPDMASIVDTSENNIFGNDTYISSNGLIGSGLENISSGGMTVYEVKEGDTLSEIAESFDVSPNTIRWENNITGQSIKVGQKLNILPVTGVKHIVKKGDTLDSIANKYDADKDDIAVFNDIGVNGSLKQGDTLYVPNGVIKVVEVVQKPTSSKTTTKSTSSVSGSKAPSGYYVRPAVGPITSKYGPRKGGYHYGIDIGNARGTPVIAAASGTVIATLSTCVEGYTRCGGRYGNYITIEHSNGTRTKYAHLSKVQVSVGDTVSQGEKIGTIGNTGGSTGPHLHFEVQKSNGTTMKPPF